MLERDALRFCKVPDGALALLSERWLKALARLQALAVVADREAQASLAVATRSSTWRSTAAFEPEIAHSSSVARATPRRSASSIAGEREAPESRSSTPRDLARPATLSSKPKRRHACSAKPTAAPMRRGAHSPRVGPSEPAAAPAAGSSSRSTRRRARCRRSRPGRPRAWRRCQRPRCATRARTPSKRLRCERPVRVTRRRPIEGRARKHGRRTPCETQGSKVRLYARTGHFVDKRRAPGAHRAAVKSMGHTRPLPRMWLVNPPKYLRVSHSPGALLALRAGIGRARAIPCASLT